MAGEKACKSCRLVVKKADMCPICGGREFTTNWKGYVLIFDPVNSNIAQKMEIKAPGKYALRLSK